MARRASAPLRLAEMVASLSLATDLGLGLPQEHVLRQTVIATRLARIAGCSDDEQAAVFYVSLLAWVGCIADSPEMTHWFGDDRTLRAESYAVDKTGLPMMAFMFRHVGAGTSPVRRITVIGRFFAAGRRDALNSFVTHCQTTGDIAERLGLPDAVRRALAHAFERWDGKGSPDGLRGDQIERVTRIVQVADDAEVIARMHGVDAAVTMLRDRRGTEFDPALVDVVVAHVDDVLGGLDEVDAWSLVIDGSTALDRPLSERDLDDVLATFADYADLKSTWFLGHSRTFAELAADAAGRLGLKVGDIALARRAALVARLGVTGVANSVWDKPGPLTAFERERVQTVPYLTERILSRHPRLAELGAVAGLAHELMDGSGYPRGVAGAAIPVAARLIAAAEVYVATGEARPHRAALDDRARVALLRTEADAGRLDRDAVNAVLGAAGHRVPRRRTAVSGLTEREVEVLALLVRGRSNKEVAASLSVSAKTVGSHVEHIYAKTGVRTRGALAMFAMRHGLVDAGARQNIG